MTTLEDRIREVEEEIKRTPVNKGTEAHLAKLKAKLARLKDELEAQKEKKRKSAQQAGIKKSGDATLVLVGPPSVGKSSLVNSLANIQSKTGDYAFTTTTIVPGMMEYNHAKIQLLDVPGLIADAHENRGHGRQILSWVRMADILLIMLDVNTYTQIEEILESLHHAGIRINQEPPRVKITKKDRGSIVLVKKERQTHMSDEIIKSVLREYKIINAEVIIDEDLTLERLIDAISRNRVYPKAFVVVNKIDLISEKQLQEIREFMTKFMSDSQIHFISVKSGAGIKELKDKIYKMCGFMKVYTKKPGKKPNLEEPMIIKKGSTVKDVCTRISTEMAQHFKYARVFGSSVKFEGQKVGMDHVLEDGDIIEIHVNKL